MLRVNVDSEMDIDRVTEQGEAETGGKNPHEHHALTVIASTITLASMNPQQAIYNDTAQLACCCNSGFMTGVITDLWRWQSRSNLASSRYMCMLFAT